MGKPRVGDVFAFKLDAKLWSFCWVAKLTKADVYGTDPGLPLIAGARWVGTQLPDADAIARRKILQITCYDGRTPCVQIAQGPVPRGFVRVARLGTPTPARQVAHFGGFALVRHECQRQWKWDHARGKLLAEERADERAEAAADAAEAKALKAKLARRKSAALGALAKVDLLPEWEDVGARHKKTVDAILRALIVALRRAKDRTAKLAAIETCVLAINRWNDRSGVIETEEREALIDAIDALAHKAGVRGRDLAGDHRDW